MPRDEIASASRQLLAFFADGLKMSHLRMHATLPYAAVARWSGHAAVDESLIGGSRWRLPPLARSRALAGALRGD
jgi:hypothetical protein